MKRLPPVLAVVTQLNGRLGRRKTCAPAIHGLHSNRIERFYCVVHGVQIGMQQSNESPPEEKIKPAEGYQRRRIVKQRSRGFLYQPPLFQKAVLHHVSQALALRDFSQNLIQRSAPV